MSWHTFAQTKTGSTVLQRLPLSLQGRGARGDGGFAPPIVHEVLRSSGQPLATDTCQFMENHFQRDFSQVRVHTDAKAASSARSVGALAYTVGSQVVFAEGHYQPYNQRGRQLLAHELGHVVQQGGAAAPSAALPIAPANHPLEREAAQASEVVSSSHGALTNSMSPVLARQCDPAWAGLDWSERVNNVKAMANGTAKYQCMTDMIDEALYPNVTVQEKTNTAASVGAAIRAGQYVEWNTLSDLQVNFDARLNAKTRNASQYGQTDFRQPAPDEIDIYIILGPNALNPIGPQFTRMAFDHENEHAGDFLIQFATGTPHGATAGEELDIYVGLFSHFFLEMWEIDSTACSWRFAEDFGPMFSYYVSAASGEQDSAFDSIAMFYDVRVKGIPCNVMKFKIWLQDVLNRRPVGDAFIARINALPGLGLVRGTSPNDHFDCRLGCS